MIKTTVRWVLGVLGKLILLPVLPFQILLVPLFTRADPRNNKYSKNYNPVTRTYTRTGVVNLFVPYDNPIQGDDKFLKDSLFPGHLTGVRGYINRGQWMWRNPLYGYNKAVQVTVQPDDVLTVKGTPDTSDKYKVRGWAFWVLKDKDGNVKAWEFYSNWNYTKKRNIRIRLGWKIKTDKIWLRGFARHVVTFNPFDTWG